MGKQILLQSLKEKGFSKEILKAFSKIKRENFIPKELKDRAYEDIPLPIGKGQTISQPYTIAMMLSLLDIKKGQKILEIGSGCGYVLALLSNIVGKNGKVFGIEIIKELAEKSKENLRNYKNIKVYNKNGRFGLKENAPFDRIIISAAAYDEIPKPLISQLKEKGILVAPLGNRYGQDLIAYQKINGKLKLKEKIPGFIFVPLVER
ncbi:protein-L-isoaspartate O-methyltransferase [Candidatus Pacearchaeota archaeon]|nr:protein-L-isoaspartate O-methyltransferase [Candidatus Pacearchaeota archaeon]